VVGVPPLPEHHRPQAQRTDLHARPAKSPKLHHPTLDNPATLPRYATLVGCLATDQEAPSV
jgi:hypothetical protein